MSEKQKIYLFTSIVIVSLGLLLSWFYRPYIYANKINDWGFADVIGSLVSVIGFCCFAWGLREYSNSEKNKHILMTTLVYGFGWELLGLLQIHGTFDKKDIFAAIVSGVITFLLKEILERKYSMTKPN